MLVGMSPSMGANAIMNTLSHQNAQVLPKPRLPVGRWSVLSCGGVSMAAALVRREQGIWTLASLQ